MRALALVLVLTATPLLATPLLAQESNPRISRESRPAAAYNIAGNYTVSGRNPDGSGYSGTVTLSLQGDAYQVLWTIAGQQYSGTGRLDGRVLTVDWQGDSNPVIYVVMPDGSLHGTWADGYALDRLAPAR